MLAALQGWLVKLKAASMGTYDLGPLVVRSCFYALLWTIPILALLVIALNAVLPAPDPATGERAGAWLAPAVFGTAGSIYIALLLWHLYVHRIRKESVPAFLRHQVQNVGRRIAAARERAGVSTLLDALLARTVAVVLMVLGALLCIALVWLSTAALSATPWWALLTMVLLVIVLMK
jgi:hypothetical protein